VFDDIIALAKRADDLKAFLNPEDDHRIRQDMLGLRLPIGQIETAHMFARDAMAEIRARLDTMETAARLLETNERPALWALR
jgi:hypothetical protein